MDFLTPLFSSLKQNKSSFKELRRTQALAVEFEEFTEKPLRRICKLATSSPDSDDKDLQELYESLPRFGPIYQGHDPLMSQFKEAAWLHVLSRSPTTESETNQIYQSAMQKICTQARNAYPDDDTLGHRSSRFLWMMIKDGCFILQLALFLLGGSVQLNYPPDHLIFGQQRNTKQIKKWAKSIFFVGNQVPQVVLKELMKQLFFQQVVSTGRWKRPSDSFGRAFYDLLLLPELETSKVHRGTFSTLFQGLHHNWGFKPKGHLLQQQTTDILHGLHQLIIGSGIGTIEDEYEEGDLEGDGEDFGDGNAIRSATELRQAGIHFRNARGVGIRGITFKTNMFNAVLALPTLVVDDDTEVMFRYLKNYEITQQLGRNKRDVRSYLQFMSELIRAPQDAKLLSDRGIIQANRNQREKLPGILNSLAGGDSTQNLRVVRLQIEDYSRPPWEKIRNFLSVVVLLTVVQTVYTVLGYYKKP